MNVEVLLIIGSSHGKCFIIHLDSLSIWVLSNRCYCRKMSYSSNCHIRHFEMLISKCNINEKVQSPLPALPVNVLSRVSVVTEFD